MVERVSSSILLRHVPNNPVHVRQDLLPSSHLLCRSTVSPLLLSCLPPALVQEVEVPVSVPVAELPVAVPVAAPEVDPLSRLSAWVEVEGR